MIALGTLWRENCNKSPSYPDNLTTTTQIPTTSIYCLSGVIWRFPPDSKLAVIDFECQACYSSCAMILHATMN